MEGLDLIDNYRRFLMATKVLLEPREISVATTPSDVVLTEDDMKLLHYRPRAKRTTDIPVLIVYALVNRYYILDLQSDKSVVRKMLDDGLDVYMIDWGYPSGADRWLTLDDYINDYMNAAVDEVRKRSGQDKINLIGVCQGGTFSVIYTALHPEKVLNLVTLVTPVDFDTNKGLLHVWAKALDVDRLVDAYGIIPGDIMNTGFLLTDPFRLLIDKYVGLFEKMECDRADEECLLANEETVKNFLRMEKWIFDSPNQAGEAYRQFIKDCYQKNLLIKNQLMIDGKKVDLRNIKVPLLNIMAERDHLVPNDASKPLNDAVGSTDKDMAIYPTGHIGIFVSGKSQREIVPKITSWLIPRSNQRKAPEGSGQGIGQEG
jgi:polyhydroxyalkanoate synthase